MKVKKICAVLLTGIALLSVSVPAFANEDVETYEVSITSVVGKERASWGEIVLTTTSSNAYSTTKTYAGTAYKITAKVTGTDANGSIPASSNSASNSSSATTGKILKRSGSVTWTGSGTMQDTSSSGVQSGTISKSY